MRKIIFLLGWIFIFFSVRAQYADIRNIGNAVGQIPEEGYCDQPYVVVAHNGDWIAVLTTGPGRESQKGQHIVASVSKDEGKTWSEQIAIEPGDGPAASWAIPYITAYGRIYVFYTYNGDRIDSLNGKPLTHNTELGWYCFKYSDDNGRTWSQRYRLPLRKTVVDYINPWNGKVQLFWGISKPRTLGNSMVFAFTKMAIHPQNMGEGWFFVSDNINTERNPGNLHWQLLPDGDIGLCETSLGLTQEEFNIVTLGDKDLYCIFRTDEGYPAESYSHDGGHTWSKPVFARYGDGRVIKNPRACPRLFQCSNGNYLLWFHNNNIRGYEGYRNPAWISGGVLRNGKIHWSQPEILLYGAVEQRISYPDLIEQDGKYWVSETNKKIARVHKVDAGMLNRLWGIGVDNGKCIEKGLVWRKQNLSPGMEYPLPVLPDLETGAFTIDLLLDIDQLTPGAVVLDNTNPRGDGFRITISARHTLELSLKDGPVVSSWDTDPGVVKKGRNHIVFIVDGAANLMTTVVNGKLCDGGRYRHTGWWWFDPAVRDVNGRGAVAISSAFRGHIRKIRLYDRYLLVSEAVQNYHYESGKKKKRYKSF